MSENDNLKRLKEISSTVSDRDLKIYENVAHSICIRKETEKLKGEIARMRAATDERKKENRMLGEQSEELTKTLQIQSESLQASERSVVMQKALKESLLREANDFKNKYTKTLEMYNDELQDHRSVYENSSQGYKELKALQIEMKKLEIKSMMLDIKIENEKKSQKLYKKIQEDIFRTTIVKFAEFYLLHHKSEKLKQELQENKKEEQQLLKEHIQLSEAVKQRKRMQLNKTKSNPISREDSIVQTPEASSEKGDMTYSKLQKFLNEDLSPCSLTSFSSSQKVLNFNDDNTKVKVLDVKIMKPQPPKPVPVKRTKLELRKQMQNIMQEAKEEARSTNSFQLQRINSQRSSQEIRSGNSQNKTNNENPSGSQSSQTSQKQGRNEIVSSKEITKPPSQLSQNMKPTTSVGSQASKRPQSTPNGSQKMETSDLPLKVLRVPEGSNSQPLGAVQQPKEVVTSILKPSSQEKQETVSKYFNAKKKSVTFENGVKKEKMPDGINKFQMFVNEEKQVDSSSFVGKMDIFQNQLFLKNDKIKNIEDDVLMREVPADETPANVSFIAETGPTAFGTCGTGSTDKKNDITFALLTSPFQRSFEPMTSPENFAPATESTFNFFGSKAASKNPFSFL